MQKTILFSIVACACMCAVGAVVFAAEGTAPPVKVYPAVPRRAYLAGERIDLVVVLGDGAAGELAIFLDDGRSAGVVARQAVERPGTLTFAVDSTYLKSGTYTIGARLGEAEVRWSERDKPIQLTLISNQPATNLSMVSFGQGFTREEMFTPSKVADLGYNLRMMERERPKTPQQGRPRVGIPRLLPHEQEVDDYLALGIRAHVANTVHWGLAHQVIRRGGCYNDPALIQFALQEMTIAAQHIRQFPSLEGASSGDELALTWTPNKAGNFDTVGSCRICRAAFEAKAGRPAPAREEAGNDEALWAQWMRWRSDTWTDFMTAVGRELKAVAPEKLWMADVYAPTAFGDGVYPTQATAGDGLFTHHYSIWEAAGQGVVPMACELQRAGCNWEMPFWPMVSAWLLQDLEPQLHRHMLNLAISRKIDGIGTWGPLGGQAGEAVIKEEMGKLARYGDFYKALKRRRGDVAVLYSFTEMAHLLGGTFEDSYARNENRLAHVLPFAEAFLTSYRAHYNTSVILEEEILAGDLKYCKVLLVPAAPHLPKNVTAAIERYIEAGGAAFVEKSSPLAIKGARRLSMDFSTLTEARKKTAEAYAAEKQRNEGKTDEESVYEAWKLESDVVQEAGIDRQAKILDLLLAKAITKFADAPRPRVMLSEQDFGDARYVFAVNSEMALPDPPISKMTKNGRLFLTQHIVPVETTLSFQKDAGRYAAYDLYEGKAVDLSKPLPLALEPGGMKVLCLLPRKIDGLRVTAPPAGKAGTSVEVAIAVLGGGAPINAAIPLEITIADPDGASQTVCRAAAPGTYTHKLDLPLNVKAGEWRVTARELLSGKQAACSIAVEAGDPMQMARLLPGLQVFDETPIRSFLQKKRPVWVVSGQAAAGPVTKLAQDLTEALKNAGIRAEHHAAEDIRQDHKNLPAYLDAWFIFKDPATGRAYPKGEVIDPATGKPVPDTALDGIPLVRPIRCVSQTAPSWVDISHDLILIGDRGNNVLIDDIENAAMLPRILTDEFPGAGNAMIEYAWSPFEYDYNVILLLASRSDGPGLSLAAEQIKRWAGRQQQ